MSVFAPIGHPAAVLLAVGLVVAALPVLGLRIAAQALSSAMCRGLDCLDWTTTAQGHVSTAYLADGCFYLGSPTGIGIFNRRPFGRAARMLLGQEYMLLGREFLFMEPASPSEPVTVIDANRYRVAFPPESFCRRGPTIVTLDAERETITVEGCPSGVVQTRDGRNECPADGGGRPGGKTGGESPLP